MDWPQGTRHGGVYSPSLIDSSSPIDSFIPAAEENGLLASYSDFFFQITDDGSGWGLLKRHRYALTVFISANNNTLISIIVLFSEFIRFCWCNTLAVWWSIDPPSPMIAQRWCLSLMRIGHPAASWRTRADTLRLATKFIIVNHSSGLTFLLWVRED